MREKLSIYPFDIASAPIVRHYLLMQDYEVVNLVSPAGWGLSGKDAGEIDGGEKINIDISSDFVACLKNCDAVLFMKSENELDFGTSIYPKILQAIEGGKNIICTVELEFNILQEIQSKCECKNLYFKYYNFQSEISFAHQETERIISIDTPVVFVVGLAERTNKFEVQLSLRESLLKEGYKVSQVGTRSYCEMLGFHSFPSFMFSTAIPESQKVVLFNKFIKKIEVEEDADIIVVGIPGGIMPFDREFTNRFGILAYEVSNAVLPDFAVLSTLYEDYKSDFFNELSKSIKYKLGYEVDCFNISTLQFDWVTSREFKSAEYTSIKADFIKQKIENLSCLDKPVYCALEKEGFPAIFDTMINKLSEYSRVESL